MNNFKFFDAYCFYDDNFLTVGNDFFCRVIDLTAGFPRTVSLTAGGEEFASAEKKNCDISFFGINMPGREETDFHITGINVIRHEKPAFDAPHLEVILSFGENIQQARFERIFRIYSGIPAYSVQNTLISGSIPGCYWTYRSELSAACDRFPDHLLESCTDSFSPAAECNFTQAVEFCGRTDYHNCMVKEHPVLQNRGKYCGNILLFENISGQKSGIILQEAPPSSERRDFEKYDFRLDDSGINSCGWGVAPGELIPGRKVSSYRNTMIFFSGKDQLTDTLHHYLARRFPMQEQEAAVLVNPWGCGKFPELTSPEFLLDEIAAAGSIGAELYQIDDSWQQGKGLNELTGNNRAVTMDFWETSAERLPCGFVPLKNAAEQAGIKLGLWCAPTYTGMYRDHDDFAQMLLDYHRRYGFATVKIDGVRLQSLESQENLEKMLRKVREESGKKVFFNLDTTNGQRPGYFYFLEYGNIFLENRYCYGNGEICYHPAKTLRNLWQLSKYVRPQTLQIEVPVPEDIPDNKTFDADPRDYSFDYWCAVALFANMLIWTAPSQLSGSRKEELLNMVTLHRKLRKEIFDSVISPLGTVPNGKSFTGFVSDKGYALIFKELMCETPEFILPSDAEIIAGNGSVRGNVLTMTPASWCLLSFHKALFPIRLGNLSR